MTWNWTWSSFRENYAIYIYKKFSKTIFWLKLLNLYLVSSGIGDCKLTLVVQHLFEMRNMPSLEIKKKSFLMINDFIGKLCSDSSYFCLTYKCYFSKVKICVLVIKTHAEFMSVKVLKVKILKSLFIQRCTEV